MGRFESPELKRDALAHEESLLSPVSTGIPSKAYLIRRVNIYIYMWMYEQIDGWINRLTGRSIDRSIDGYMDTWIAA